MSSRARVGACGQRGRRPDLTLASCLSSAEPGPGCTRPPPPRDPQPAARPFVPAPRPTSLPRGRTPASPGQARPLPGPRRPHPTPAQPQAQPPPRPAPTLSPSSGYCYPGALWAHGPLFIAIRPPPGPGRTETLRRLYCRFVMWRPGSLTCLSPSALRKPAAASGLLGAPEEGYLVWRVGRAALKRGQRRVSPHSASQLREPHARRLAAHLSAAAPLLRAGRCPERRGAGWRTRRRRPGEAAAAAAAWRQPREQRGEPGGRARPSPARPERPRWGG